VPAQVELVRKLHGSKAVLPVPLSKVARRSYRGLDTCMFNFNDAERSYAFANFGQVDDSLKEHLKLKKVDPANAPFHTVLNTKLELL
jgi:hypothetical protein